IGFFLHVPFPPPEIMTALPNHERLIPSLGYYDVAGFQTTNDAGNFARYLVRECRFTKVDPYTFQSGERVFASKACRSASKPQSSTGWRGGQPARRSSSPCSRACPATS